MGLTIEAISTYVKAHERLLAICLGAALVWFVSGKIQDVIVAHDQKVYTLEQAKVQADAQKNAELAQQLQAQVAKYEVLAEQVQRQNLMLEQANATLAAALTKQQAIDRTLPPAELAQRIETLAALPPASVVPASGENFTVTKPAAVGIAVALENVPALQGQLANVQQAKANVETQLGEQTKLVLGLNGRVDGLLLQIADGDKACKAEVALVKAQAAKAKRKYLIVGAILGAIARSFVPKL